MQIAPMRSTLLGATWALLVLPAVVRSQVTGPVAAACDTFAAPRTGIVSGRVIGRADSAAIAGARVVARWATQSSTVDSGEVRSDARGNFTLCGLPFGRKAYLRADDGTGESDPVPVVVDQTAPRARVAIEIDVIEERVAPLRRMRGSPRLNRFASMGHAQ
jgi:hypothetical protein